MHQLSVIKYLDSTNAGPISTLSGEAVHLRQGEMDGACGHYSFMMIMLMFGEFKRRQVYKLLRKDLDADTQIAVFSERIRKIGFFDGTYINDIKKILKPLLHKYVLDDCEGNGPEIKQFILEKLQNDCPVMVALDFPDGAHWVVAVGIDQVGEGSESEPYRFLLLDPSATNPVFGFWNGAVSFNAETKGRYPYTWWTETETLNVSLRYALSFDSKA